MATLMRSGRVLNASHIKELIPFLVSRKWRKEGKVGEDECSSGVDSLIGVTDSSSGIYGSWPNNGGAEEEMAL